MSLKDCLFFILSILFTAFPAPAAHAQISTDGTFSPAMQLPGPDFRIGAELGKQVEGNLFHSFSDFNIRLGEIATFAGPDSVKNIISRVTGGNVSQIDGLLRSEIPGANFFMFNPAGLMFGKNASIDIGGSFHISTADYLRLGEKGRFDALSGEKYLLTAAPPSAFGFLRQSPSDIEIKGNLEVPKKQSLSIFGGNVNVSGGVLTAPGGQINIFSTASAGEIIASALSEPEFPSFEKLGDISFSDNAVADVSADQAGEIHIRGGNFFLSGAGTMISAGTVDSNGGGIDIRMREAIHFTDYGNIFTLTTGEGNSGNISLYADSLMLDTGRISTESGFLSNSRAILLSGKGNSGDISLNITTVDIRGGMISTNTLDTGNSGNISISGDLLQIREQGIIVADNGNIYPGEDGKITSGTVIGGKGDSGNISLNLNRLEMDSASISSNTLGYGSGGTISINASESVNISGSEENVSQISPDIYYGLGSQALESGKGGNISITTDELNLAKDAIINGQTYGSGRGGNVSLNIDRLNLSSGGTVTTSTRGTGDSGDIWINAEESVNISGTGTRIEKSWVYTATHSSGRGGNLSISTPLLRLSDKAAIYSGSLGDYPFEDMTDGAGGDIQLTADDLELKNNAVISAESLSRGNAGNIDISLSNSFTSDTAFVKTDTKQSDGGDISIRNEGLMNLKNSTVTTSVKGGSGNGGDIEINDPEFVVLNHSGITANAYEGKGGNVRIVSDQFVRSSGSAVSASSKLGIDGNILIEAPDTDIASALTALPENYLDSSRWIKTPCAERSGEKISRFAETGRDALPTAPDDWLASPLARAGEQVTLSLNPEDFSYLQTLLCLCENCQSLGHHQRAVSAFSQAISFFEKSPDPGAKALFFSSFGDLHLSLGNKKNAKTYLTQGTEQARASKNPLILSAVLNNAANLFASDKDYEEAEAAYKESLEGIEEEGTAELKSKIFINLARLAFQRRAYQDTDIVKPVENAKAQIENLPDSSNKAWDFISLSLLALKIRNHPDIQNNLQYEHILKGIISESLDKAGKIAEKGKDARIASLAFGYLGQFFEEEKQYEQALNLTRKAIFFAEQQYCPEILYLWQHQAGRLFKASDERDHAVEAYRNAIATLNPILKEFFRGYRGKTPSFYENIKPVYLGLTELLLDETEGGISDKNRLIRARDTMELLKTAELEDFFQDECVTALKKNNMPDMTAPAHTAVIYPISLPDRLELLVTLPDGIRRIRVPIVSEVFREEVKTFRERLEDFSIRYKYFAKKLYEVLIGTVESDLIRYKVDTLVIVPDDVLRLIPFSVLINPESNRFLIEDYAVVTVPALSLSDYQSPVKKAGKSLLCGLSQGNPPLPYVPEELKRIKEITGQGKILLNQDFTLANLAEEFKNQVYSTVLISTHGAFGASPEDTYLMTSDSRMTMNDLEKFIRFGRFREEQIELLTLSACRSAAGDERAASGLAGIAVKAGVRSAMATLWNIDDEAASLIVTEFHRQFVKGLSKAKSLQEAQKKFIYKEIVSQDKRKDFTCPAYWAQFLLIGNWL